MAQQAQVLPLGEENEIRQLFVDFTRAMQAKDIERIMSYYASDLVAFDMMPPLRFVGRDQYRKSWEFGFSMMQGSWDFEQRDLKVHVSGDLAFCHALNHASGKLKDGDNMDGWMRWTCCLRKIDGKWKIVHEHNSVPIDMESNKALWKLEP
ncbi:MAG: nuclear transport factor 2 family protein [Oligoflexia bacterium]|nr:nuclear transport factor 2 family protein [Oligoflexia bacterium]